MKIAPRLFGLDSSMVPVGCCAAGVAANRQQQKQRITHTMAWAGWIYIDQQVWLVHWTVVSDGHRLPLPLGLFFFLFFLVWLWRGGKSETIGRIAWWTDPFFFFFFFSGPTKKHITLRVARQARYPKTMHPKTPVTSCFGRRYPQWNRQKERRRRRDKRPREEETHRSGPTVIPASACACDMMEGEDSVVVVAVIDALLGQRAGRGRIFQVVRLLALIIVVCLCDYTTTRVAQTVENWTRHTRYIALSLTAIVINCWPRSNHSSGQLRTHQTTSASMALCRCAGQVLFFVFFLFARTILTTR